MVSPQLTSQRAPFWTSTKCGNNSNNTHTNAAAVGGAASL